MRATILLMLLCGLAGLVSCQNYCWTRWLDRDNPGRSGDWETLKDFPPEQVCPEPVGIECHTLYGAPYQGTGKLDNLANTEN